MAVSRGQFVTEIESSFADVTEERKEGRKEAIEAFFRFSMLVISMPLIVEDHSWYCIASMGYIIRL